MALTVYNTLTRRKEPFLPLHPGEVRMYVCGITPYDLCHIGHARAALVFEVIRRFLEFRGFQVIMVRNFTDIDDKIIAKAKSLGQTWRQVADRFIAEYHQDMKALGLGPATYEPKATDHIAEMIDMVKALEAKGYAYALGGDVYFEVRKFPSYGKLSRRDLDQMLAGARVEVDSRKKDPLDFALWKSSKENEPSWESPWGPGRPGWHLECSVMSIKYLGETFDIHGGGADLVFPHHENEIAQSESYTGKEFARYWLHNGFVSIDSEKMSKSLGNFFTIRQVLERYDPDTLKLFLLSTHYRAPVDYSDGKLKEAQRALDRAQVTLEKAEQMAAESKMGASSPAPLAEIEKEGERAFVEAMEDDFHTPRAIASLFDMIRQLNGYLEKGPGTPFLGQAAGRIRKLAGIFGLLERRREVHFVEDEDASRASVEGYEEARERIESHRVQGIPPAAEDVKAVLLWRARARKRGDWEASDAIRGWMKQVGILVEDAKEGFYWKYKPSQE
ncbi:MAG: cysteine--tRNA ligase [candidate division NC10 bacterium]|nr:cysteine--tRNA ligase [candidate division NC10 bacterium]